MKSFLKYVLATFVALFVFTVIGFLIFFGTLGVMLSSGDKKVELKQHSILVLETSDLIPDRSPEYPVASMNPLNFTLKYQTGLNDILKNLEEAANDPKIEGLHIKAGIVPVGFATGGEIRQAIKKFKESGKFVTGYSDFVLTQSSLFLAAAADEFYLNPVSNVEFTGLRSEVIFYKNALDKLGVDVQVVKHGKFKSAVEPYMQDEMSSENREQINKYLGSIWEYQVEGLAEDLKRKTAELDNLVDGLKVFTAKDAVENNIATGFLYEDELIDLLREKSGIESGKDLRLVSMVQYSKTLAKKATSRNKIAVVYASGNIVMGSGSDMSIGAGRFAETIREARSDSSIKAIVLRINSPGGSALASEIIWRELDLTSEVKPVVVSMGNVAASGGYYIATTADTVFAQPNTITGSIGVFGLIPTAADLLNEKIGITTEVVKTHNHSDFPSLTRPMTTYEKQVMQRSIEQTYDTFVTRVSKGRGLSWEEVDGIGQGRVWSGADALEIGLVDAFGGLEDAINEAARMAGVTEYRIQERPFMEDPYMKLLKDLSGGMKNKILSRELGTAAPYYKQLKEIIRSEGVMMRLPYQITLY